MTNAIEKLELGMAPKENTVKDMNLGPTIGPKRVTEGKATWEWGVDFFSVFSSFFLFYTGVFGSIKREDNSESASPLVGWKL